MSIRYSSWQLWWCCAVTAAVLVLSGCGVFGPRIQTHGFSFNPRDNSPDVKILSYQYGESKHPGARASVEDREDKAFIGSGVFGPMLRGDFLYVKWRNIKTGVIFEDRVDLKSRLPWDITNHEIYFLVSGKQLYVYLIMPEKRPYDWPNYLDMYRDRKVLQLYPDPVKPKF